MSNRIEYISATIKQHRRKNSVAPTKNEIGKTILNLFDYDGARNNKHYATFEMRGDDHLLRAIKDTMAYLLLDEKGNVISCLQGVESKVLDNDMLKILITGKPISGAKLPIQCTLVITGTIFGA